MQASASGATITITYLGAGLPTSSTTGANGNLIGAYTYVSGSQTEQWDAPSRLFSGGTSPSQWQITLPFASLSDPVLGVVPASSIRKLRWTYSAALQPGAFVRSEFQVVVSNWTVTGSGQVYSIAGPGSQRMEDDSNKMQYSGTWTSAGGNFSGGTIHATSAPGSSVTCTYTFSQDHSLYLGTRLLASGTLISIVVDAGSPFTANLDLAGEDVLVRSLLAQPGPGTHTVTVTHNGDAGTYFYFDFLEIAIPTTTLPTETSELKLTAATDWDTLHSQALAPERTAWMIYSLGFQARVNHYVGALWFYELTCVGQQYASATVTFSGSPDPNLVTQIILGTYGQPSSEDSTIEHLNLIGDTTETLATAFALLLNGGYTAVWAQASGSQLTIYSRSMGTDGNAITIATSAATTDLTITISGTTTTSGVNSFSGGADGNWYTDPEATPRLNRAVRDWSQSYFEALSGYGFDVTASFSMELGNGDPSAGAGIAQCYPDQTAVVVSTPALQTNFSPASAAFWQQVHLDMAAVMNAAGLTPYLQFGEVQWWYFPQPAPSASGMPFYDAYTTSTFQAQYGRAMTVIASNTVDPTTIPQEAAFLPGLIGSFTAQIRAFVRGTFPMLRDATLTSFLRYSSNGIRHELNKSESVLVMKDTGSRIYFRAVDDFERLRGTNLAWFGLDELTYTAEEAWLRLEGRLRDPRASRLCGFAVWTPKGFDWVYRRFVRNVVAGYEVVLAKPFENRHVLDKVPDFYERLRESYDHEVFRAGSAGRVSERPGRRGVPGIPAQAERAGSGDRWSVAVVLGVGFQRGSDEFDSGAEER